MSKSTKDFTLEYQFNPAPDAEGRLQQAYELILALILEDLQQELAEGETC